MTGTVGTHGECAQQRLIILTTEEVVGRGLKLEGVASPKSSTDQFRSCDWLGFDDGLCFHNK